MSHLGIRRRTLLGLLGISAATLSSRAFAKAPPKIPQRFLGLWHANGWRVLPRDHPLYDDPQAAMELDKLFFPAQKRAPSYELASVDSPWPDAIAPLQRHQAKLTILDGIANPAMAWGEPHPYGAMTFFSGAEPLAGQMSSGGPSIDHHLSMQNRSSLAGLHVGVGQRVPRVRISHAGAAQPNLSHSDPRAVYARVFAPLIESDNDQAQAKLAELRRRRKSVLDQNAKELNALSKWLSARDKQRLQAHANAIRDAERRLDATASEHETCKRPSELPKINPYLDADTPAISQVMLDLLTAAFACDLTRTGTMFYGYGTGSFVPTWLGGLDPLHVMSHWPHADPRQSVYTATLGWISEQVATLLDRLDNIIQADGQSLLDHSLLMWGSDVGSGQLHTTQDIPVILAGGANGKISTGRVHSFEQGTPVNRLHLTISAAFGASVQRFGEERFCKDGPLRDLLK